MSFFACYVKSKLEWVLYVSNFPTYIFEQKPRPVKLSHDINLRSMFAHAKILAAKDFGPQFFGM